MLLAFIAWTWDSNGSYGPGMYSVFHIIWLIIMIGLCVGAVIWAKKNPNDKTVDRTIISINIFLLVTEILKQILYQGSYYGYFRIDVLPLAYCSFPMYVGLIGGWVKNEKVKKACYSFVSYYGVIGGLAAMLYPITLMTTLIYISYQTMIWHSLLVAMAVYLIVAKGYGRSFKQEIIPGFIVLLLGVTLAIGLNEITYHSYLKPRQTPVCEIDRNPGSYQTLKYGYEHNGEFFFLGENESGLRLTQDVKESLNIIIVYPDSDNDYTTYLLKCEKDDKNQYLEINKDKELVLVDSPTQHWEFIYIGSRPVMAIGIDGENYTIDFTGNNINVINIKDSQETDILNDFIVVSIQSEGDYANFFFISHHCLTPIPILNKIQPQVPYLVFIIIYLSGLCGIASMLWGITHLIVKIKEKRRT